MISYGERIFDKVIISGCIFARFVFASLAIINESLYQKMMHKTYKALPDLRLKTPYGRYKTRKRTIDIAILRPDYEPAVAKAMFKHSKGVCIDVGANFGRHAVSLGRAKPELRVIAIEPEPDNYSALVKNIGLSRLRNIMPVQAACTAKTGKVSFYTAGRERHAEATTSQKVADKWKDTKKIVVQGISLDDFLKKQRISVSEVSVIKIDVEGAETEVLKGAKNLLENGNARIIFEAWSEKEFVKCKEIFERYNYSVSTLDLQNFLAEKL